MDTILIVVLGAIAALLGWRHWHLLSGLKDLNQVLSTNPSPKTSDLRTRSGSDQLAALSRTVLNHSAEATLTRDLEASRRQLLEALLNEIKDALFIVDEDSEIRYANQAAAQLFPSEQGILGRPLIEVCLDHRIVDTIDLAWELDSKTQDRFNRRVGDSEDDRAERIYLVEAEPFSSRGLGQGAWMLIRDTTLQLETERIRRDFVANASHELRTPLSIISGYLEMLDVSEDGDEAAIPYLESLKRSIPTMRKHADRLSRIVDDMLTISKLETHDEFLNRDTFDLVDCIKDTVEHLQPIIDEQHARLQLDLPEESMMIGDRFYWDQVFFNLIENALKQNPDPGLRVTISLVPEDGRYRIEIIDDGVGIPAADIPHVFKRFYRVQKDHSQNVKGTGLGLSIVKRAVEAHHGTIRVKSQPGRETNFIIEVPQPPAPKLEKSDHSNSRS